MSSLKELKVAGFYRPRPGKPGFAIAVFRSEDSFWVQQSEGECITGFVRCDIEEEDLLQIKELGQKTFFHGGSRDERNLLVKKVGDKRLYGFARPDGALDIGPKAELGPVLQKLADELIEQPFVLKSVALFIGSKVLAEKAESLVASLLGAFSKRWNPIIVESATIGKGGFFGRQADEHDYDAVEQVATTLCRVWEKYCSQFGFQIYVSASALKGCYDMGSEILQHYFPQPPSVFKRVAALVILSRIVPFYHTEPVLPFQAREKWLTRVSALLIPVALAKLRVNLTPDEPTPTWKRLDGWIGFPSPKLKLEFLQFLEVMNGRIGATAPLSLWERDIKTDTAQMIAATALFIEACYSWGEAGKASTREQHNEFFNVGDANFMREFNYDEVIYRGIREKQILL